MGAVLVTGATGQVGGATLAHLIGRRIPVLAGVRDTAEPLPVGAEARHVDFDDPASWPDSLRGVDRMLLVRPPAIADVEHTLIPFIDMARSAGVRRIVFLSVQGAGVAIQTPHHRVERHLRRGGRRDWVFLRPNFFMQNLSSTLAAGIRDRSEIAVPAGRASTALIDVRDIGRVAAQILTEPSPLGRAYTLSGEQSLDYDEVARILTDVLGRDIRYSRPSPRDYEEHMRAEGATADWIAVQRMIWRTVRLRVSARPNREVRAMTGSPATTFRRFAEDHRAVWGG